MHRITSYWLLQGFLAPELSAFDPAYEGCLTDRIASDVRSYLNSKRRDKYKGDRNAQEDDVVTLTLHLRFRALERYLLKYITQRSLRDAFLDIDESWSLDGKKENHEKNRIKNKRKEEHEANPGSIDISTPINPKEYKRPYSFVDPALYAGVSGPRFNESSWEMFEPLFGLLLLSKRMTALYHLYMRRTTHNRGDNAKKDANKGEFAAVYLGDAEKRNNLSTKYPYATPFEEKKATKKKARLQDEFINASVVVALNDARNRTPGSVDFEEDSFTRFMREASSKLAFMSLDRFLEALFHSEDHGLLNAARLACDSEQYPECAKALSAIIIRIKPSYSDLLLLAKDSVGSADYRRVARCLETIIRNVGSVISRLYEIDDNPNAPADYEVFTEELKEINRRVEAGDRNPFGNSKLKIAATAYQTVVGALAAMIRRLEAGNSELNALKAAWNELTTYSDPVRTIPREITALGEQGALKWVRDSHLFKWLEGFPFEHPDIEDVVPPPLENAMLAVLSFFREVKHSSAILDEKERELQLSEQSSYYQAALASEDGIRRKNRESVAGRPRRQKEIEESIQRKITQLPADSPGEQQYGKCMDHVFDCLRQGIDFRRICGSIHKEGLLPKPSDLSTQHIGEIRKRLKEWQSWLQREKGKRTLRYGDVWLEEEMPAGFGTPDSKADGILPVLDGALTLFDPESRDNIRTRSSWSSVDAAVEVATRTAWFTCMLDDLAFWKENVEKRTTNKRH